MAALTKDRNTPNKHLGRKAYMKVAASTTIYKGAVVAVNAAGFVVPAADTAGLEVVGMAETAADNSSGANGDLSIEVWREAVVGLIGAGVPPTQAEVGRLVMVETDNEVTTAADATNDITMGTLDEIGDDGLFYVKLHGHA